MNPLAAIDAGRQFLDPVCAAHGFEFRPGTTGNSSGGPYATAEYVRGERRLAISFRWGLGDVWYWIGNDTLDHATYMRLLGHYLDSRFASCSRDEPLAGFLALAHDLREFAGDFLCGNGAAFRRFATQVAAMPDGRLPAYLP